MSTVLEKMRIKAPHSICTLNAPVGFSKALGPHSGITITENTKENFDSLHWFVLNKTQVDKETQKVMKLLKPGKTIWCYFPKSTSKIQTDLTRDKGWETLLSYPEIKWINLISFDGTWSTFAFRLMTDKDKKAREAPEREIYKYADSKTKTINLPEDIANAFANNKKAKAVFDALAFSHRREYVEWVVTAKREETRLKRIEGTLEKLIPGYKFPAEKK